jgi:two-component system phosphate regulon sensor histidine kinase PhoR
VLTCLAVATALLVASAFLSGSAHWFAITAFIFFIGLTFGAVIWNRSAASNIPTETANAVTTAEFPIDLLNATLNEMREGLLVIDSEMRVVASNQAARHLFSNVDDSINARRLTELTRNPAIYDAFLDAVRGKERAGEKVETFVPERRVFDLRVAPLHAGDGSTGAVGVFFDVTRIERFELIRQEFLSNVSHELRTPLTSIVALAETLEAGALEDRNNNRRFLAIIQKNAARMHRLIDDILELSAIEAGNVKLQREPIQLRPLVEDIVSSVSATAASRKITLNNLVSADAQVFADPHRLMQMLVNLIDNAIKFNRDGGAASITFTSDDYDRISVEDTGEGIPSHHLDRLFERFYRVDRARSRELGGTGLGLAIVKHLAKSHGGEVSVESRFGEGTKFTIELPRRADENFTSISIDAART